MVVLVGSPIAAALVLSLAGRADDGARSFSAKCEDAG
jgi:hypothetical protein